MIFSGRKRAAIIYTVTYTFGCFTKHFNHFWVLFVGRVFCGVATSLLYSAFESWLVAEHFKVGDAKAWVALLWAMPRWWWEVLCNIASPCLCFVFQFKTVKAAPLFPRCSAASTPTGWATPSARRCSWGMA